MNNLEIQDIKIENLIYEIRGKQVMLDSDLARLYNCKNGAKTINQAVKRHINRFPERFMFQLTYGEYENLRSHIVTANNMSRVLPYAFTEQGVAMLSSILRTDVAEEISIKIMDAFVLMRHYIGNNEFRSSNVESKIIEHDNNLLNIISKLNIKVILITTNKYINKEIMDKYKTQYNNLDVIYNNSFHDRYFILDKNKFYHCGTSLNRIGFKTFSINVINDEITYKSLLNNVKGIINS